MELATASIYERQIAMAQAALNTAIQARDIYIGHLLQMHGLSEGWTITDWARGFERREE